MLNNLNKVAKDTNIFLKKYLRKQKYSGLIVAMNYGLFPGGKKIRSKILIDVGKIFNVNYNNLIKIGAAVECVHAYSLIHDDLPCMDNDYIRRGKPSTHIKFDEATAVLAGNSLLALSFEILSDNKLNLNQKTKNELLEIGKQLAMQIAASSPLAIDKEGLDQKILQKEKEIITDQLKNTGKDSKIVDKIAVGKLNKFISENTLLNQEWVMDPKKKVKDVLKEVADKGKIEVIKFVRFKVGEGI